MKREKGIAYCGLACCVCGQNVNCTGCRNDGCLNREWCKNRKCCIEKKIKGCWECSEFPCKGSMLDKIKVRAFARFIKENGENEMFECLAKNEKAGIVYHYAGELNGDYNKYETEEEIMQMIKSGK